MKGMTMAQSTGGGFGYALIHAAQAWRTEANTVLAPFELTVPQFLVVMALYRQARHDWPPLTQREVAERLGMDANTTSQIVRALERRGLLDRRRHPDDARANALTLTNDGVDRARDASASARAMNDVFFGVIGDEDRRTLDRILTTLSTESENRS
jgi:DNA-binding MarR family transcriptional regulator